MPGIFGSGTPPSVDLITNPVLSTMLNSPVVGASNKVLPPPSG